MGRIVAASPYKIEIVKTDGTRQTERWDNRIMGGRPSASRLAEMSAKVPAIAAATLYDRDERTVLATWTRGA